MQILNMAGRLVAMVLGIIGALLALAGLMMLYVAGWWGVIPLIFLGLAAILAFLDRGKARA